MRSLSGPVLTTAEMRAAEIASGVPLDILMERAGAALAEAVWRYGSGAPARVLCGPGNNGGDGYVSARLLADKGLSVRVAATGEPKTDLARAARASWKGIVEPFETAAPAPVLVDALLGTGLTRPLDASLACKLAQLGSTAHLVIAADLPSGVGTDDGADLGGASADVTIAFGAAKPAHVLQPAAARCGRVLIADIGIAVASDAQVLGTPELPAPGSSDHKYTRGLVAVIGGAMPGAAALAATAAARAGAGYVVAVGIDAALPNAIVRRDDLKMVLADKRLSVIVVGPGLGRDMAGWEKLSLAMMTERPVVLDGDALWLIAEMGCPFERSAPILATPHAGEFEHVYGDRGDKLTAARKASERTGHAIVFKGADTVIASPGGRATLAPAATTWLSTAGTGDVLAGIAGAMLARGLNAHDAACAAVWLHAEAARRAGAGFIADDLPAHIRL